MTGVWIYTDLISFVRVLGGWMQGGFGITYFQDTAKDMQMENCSSKSIRTRPDSRPCLPSAPPAGRRKKNKNKNITPLPGLTCAKSPWERSRWKNKKKTKQTDLTSTSYDRMVTFRIMIACFDCKRTDARSTVRHARHCLRWAPWLIIVIAPCTFPSMRLCRKCKFGSADAKAIQCTSGISRVTGCGSSRRAITRLLKGR